MTTPGFAGATASKVLFYTSVVATGYFVLQSTTSNPVPDLRSAFFALLAARSPASLGRGLLRLLGSQFAFRRGPDALVGVSILYSFRHLERLMGSKVFTTFVLCSTAVSMLGQLLWAVYGPSSSGGFAPAPGPYGPIFGLMIVYFTQVPTVRLSIFDGLNLPSTETPPASAASSAAAGHESPASTPGHWLTSRKLPVYLGGLFLLCVYGGNSLIPGVMGLLSGALTRANLARLSVPSGLAASVDRHVGAWLRSPTLAEAREAHEREVEAAARRQQRRAAAAGFPGDAAAQQGDALLPNLFGRPPPLAAANVVPERRPPAEIDEASVTSLMALGFERADALRALRRCGNNLNEAANFLLTQSG